MPKALTAPDSEISSVQPAEHRSASDDAVREDLFRRAAAARTAAA